MPTRFDAASESGIRQLIAAMTNPDAPYSCIDDILGEVEAAHGPDAVVTVSTEAHRRIEAFQWAVRRWNGEIRTAETEGAARLLVVSANGEPSKRWWYTAVLHRDEPGGPWVEVASDV
jgi:hypothetical protein